MLAPPSAGLLIPDLREAYDRVRVARGAAAAVVRKLRAAGVRRDLIRVEKSREGAVVSFPSYDLSLAEFRAVLDAAQGNRRARWRH